MITELCEYDLSIEAELWIIYIGNVKCDVAYNIAPY